MRKIELSKLTDMLNKMSIEPRQIINDLDYALDGICNAIDRYNAVMSKHITDLKEEGLTIDEETALSRSMTRARNAIIVGCIDLL